MDNIEWLKKARAKRIAKIRRRKRIDNYFRNRVYIIMIGFIGLAITLYFTIKLINEQQNDMVVLHNTMNNILTRTSSDKMFNMNQKFARAIDSLQIMIFAYNRRHQADARTIESLIESKTPTKIHNQVEFPEYIDSLGYEYEFDTISGTTNSENELILDSNIKFKENEKVLHNNVDSTSLLN